MAMANSAWGVPIPEDNSGSEYDSYESDSYSDEEDNEYGDLQMSSWGSQQPQTTTFDVPINDWHKLMDPTVKVKAGALGSGGLHRQGKNYKPVDEQEILAQRLKGTPLSSGSKKKKKSKKKNGNGPSSGKPTPSLTPKIPKKKKKNSSNRPPSSSAVRSRIPLSESIWGKSELTSKPFWETTGSGASKYATRPTSTSNNNNNQPPSSSKPQQQPRSSSQLQQQQQQPQQQPEPQPSLSKPFLGSSASRYANPTNITPKAPVPQQSQLSSLIPPSETLLKLNIEITPGITAVLDIYETDDYRKLVKDFGAKHNLIISEQAEIAFAEKIKVMVMGVNQQRHLYDH